MTTCLDVQKIKCLQTCFIYALNIAHWRENNNYDFLDNSWFSYENLSDFRGKNKTKNTNPLHFRVKKLWPKKLSFELKESVGQVKINMQIVIPKT